MKRNLFAHTYANKKNKIVWSSFVLLFRKSLQQQHTKKKRNIQLDLNNLNSATKCYKIGWILNVIYKSGVPKALNQTPNANLCHFITNSL